MTDDRPPAPGAPAPRDLSPEARARRERPAGWIPPGPRPRGDAGDPSLRPGPDEDLAYLSGDFRIFQRKRGHRWSLDDFVVALVALEEAGPEARAGERARALDLGCGAGSVLLMVAWGLPQATLVGVEAQPESLALAQRSVRYDGVDDRVQLVGHDLRDVHALRHADGRPVVPWSAFDLVTGTPPYFPVGDATRPDDAQRDGALMETRGGVEAYLEAAARFVAPEGVVVVVASTQGPPERALRAAEAAGLRVDRRVRVVPKEGKPPLLDVVAARLPGARAPDGAALGRRDETFRARLADGGLPPEMHAARARLGLPPKPGAPRLVAG